MANLNVSYQDIQTEANALQRGKEELTSQLHALQSRITNLVNGGFVTDAASGAFHSTYESFTTNATNTVAALDSLANTLNTIANTLQDTDQQLAQQIGGA